MKGIKKWFRVKNFEKYQPKRNGKHAPWIRLYHTWNLDPAIGQLHDSQKAHYLGIVCIAHSTDNQIPWDSKWIKRRGCFSSNVNLDIFEKLGLIEILCNNGEKDSEPEMQGERKRKKEKKKDIGEEQNAPRPLSPTFKVEKFWKDLYWQKHRTKPDMSPAKDRTIIKSLIETHGVGKVMSKVPNHIEGGRLLTIGGFKMLFNELGITKNSMKTFEEKHQDEIEKVKQKIRRERQNDNA